MCAQRIQLKRSSVQGRRPADQYLEPGELALNTNQNDPGLFFETNTGDIAKVGPAYIGPQPPVTSVGYGAGEQWLDSGNGTLNLYVPALDKWVPVQSPLFGGAETAIFVGSEFPEASDDLSNDGIARPFATLNRAMIEVARRSILAGRSDEVYNGRFTIVLLPGRNVVCNDPGVGLDEFERVISPFTSDQKITQDLTRLFNPAAGGLLVPRGTSIIALDMRKTAIRPTYYPFWSRELFERDRTLVEQRSSILLWTGNSYFTSFSFRDKIGSVSVNSIAGAPGEPGLLTSLRPHGFRTTVFSDDGEIIAGDRVTLSYPAGVPQLYAGSATTAAGDYYVEPVSTYEFKLRNVDTGEVILREQLPEIGAPGSSPAEFLTLAFALTTHHRLHCLNFATTDQLNEFYSKVQRAFSLQNFAGTVNNAEVAGGETTIVSQLPSEPSASVNSVANGSPYLFNCTVRSDYGMCGAEIDGARVSGFKSSLFCNFTVVSLQTDPDVYEIYDAVSGGWRSLKETYSTVSGTPLPDITPAEALDYMLSTTRVDDIRFYYRTALDCGEKSSGLTDDASDTRHFAVLANNLGYSQIVASFAIGVAVNYWAKNGSSISVTNAHSNFGGIALKAEGFAGIGTTGGAEDPDTGFTVQGVRRPAAITKSMALDPTNVKRVYVNSRIISVAPGVITFDSPIDRSALYPYTLRGGSYVWVENYDTGAVYKARLSTSENPFDESEGLTLITESEGNEIYSAVSGGVQVGVLGLMFLRRFVDPRSNIDREYSLWVSNTSQTHRPPEVGFILRFAEKPGAGVANLIKSGSQLDPGITGGWNHLFGVIDSRTKTEGDNPNGIEPLIAPAENAQSYYVVLSQLDGFKPWQSRGNNGFSSNAKIDHPKGAYASYGERPYYAAYNDLGEPTTRLVPSDQASAWFRSKNYEYCQPVGEAWISAENIVTAGDPAESDYDASSCYLRGVQFDRTRPVFGETYDFDDGTDTLGLIPEGSSVADPEFYDPWWHPSKAAMTRFLALLGFSYAQLNQMLQPQLWSQRNLSVSAMPGVGLGGYAEYTGTWPVEFNRPSTIRCGNHTWEWVGYQTYAKGLPKYQTSQLSLRERFDAISVETWGGFIEANGNTERGEFVITGKTVAGSSGTTLLDINSTEKPYSGNNHIA